MRPSSIVASVAYCLLTSSCSTQFLVTTLNTTSNSYIPQPVRQKDESNKTETYGGLQFSEGINMEYPEDYFVTADIRLAQSHALGRIRLAYGTTLALGGFYAGDGNSTEDNSDLLRYRQQRGGKLFLGSIGGNATISYAIPMPRGYGEWRIFGLQGSLNHEFGDYVHFRKDVPVEFDMGIERKSNTYTLGFFSEFVQQSNKGILYGLKFGGSLGFYQAFKHVGDKQYDYLIDYQYKDEIPELPFYFSLTHFQRIKKFNGYVQLNVGTANLNFQMGVLYTIGKW